MQHWKFFMVLNYIQLQSAFYEYNYEAGMWNPNDLNI